MEKFNFLRENDKEKVHSSYVKHLPHKMLHREPCNDAENAED